MSSDNDKDRKSESLSPRQSFGDAERRRQREERVETPQAQKAPVDPKKPQRVTVFGDNKPTDVEGPGETLLTWQVWRLAEKPLMSVAVVVGLGLLFWLLFSISQSLLATIVLTLLVIVSLAQFLFPITYTLSENGLRIQNLPITNDYKRWSRYGLWRAHADAAQIAPVVAGTRARFNRGVLVYYGRADAEKIKSIIGEKVGREV